MIYSGRGEREDDDDFLTATVTAVFFDTIGNSGFEVL
jgi:hypothetical protein